MKSRGKLGLAAMLALALLWMTAVGVGALPDPTGSPQVSMPLATLLPVVSPGAASEDVVTVSDSKLRAALHAAAGVGEATPLRRSDLARLGGGLDLSGKGIASAEGLQWCVNVTAIDLSGNKLTKLPSGMEKLTALHTIVLDGNKFTSFPTALYSAPKLGTISLRGNSISKLPDTIGSLKAVTSLDLTGNKLESVNSKVGKLTTLRTLSLADNRIGALPKAVFQLPALEKLDASGNLIKSLPVDATKAVKLAALDVSNNLLEALPEGIGSAPALTSLDVSDNRLTEVEPTLAAGRLKTLRLDINRLRTLPDSLSGKSFDAISVEWNFLDMSGGSGPRKVMESINAKDKLFSNQLLPIEQGKTTVTSTTVALTWPLCTEGSNGTGSWKVNKYYVYRVSGDSLKSLAAPDKLATSFVVTDLKEDTSYTFLLGVEYALTLGEQKYTHRSFVTVPVKTLKATATEASVVTASTGAASTAKATVTTSATASASPKATSVPAKGGGRVGTIVLVVVGVVAVGAAVALLLLYIRNNGGAKAPGRNLPGVRRRK